MNDISLSTEGWCQLRGSVKRNFLYQTFYQILKVILPFVTSPYIARVLGSKGVGVYAYTYSIINWFLIFASLGIQIYGNRLISQSRNNQLLLNKNFTSLFLFHMICSILATTIYIVYLINVPLEYPWASRIQGFYLLGNMMNIDWLFWGLEEYKLTVTRNVIIKCLSVIAVFVFVKSPDDIWKYVLIMAMGSLISSLSVWHIYKKYVTFVKVTKKEIFFHAKPMLLLCGVSIATSVFSYMDKIMLEKMSTVEQLGLYENAWKMIEFPVGFIVSLSTVLLPRISKESACGNKKKVISYFDRAMKFSLIFGIAITFGVAGISQSFSLLFWGEEFVGSGTIILLMSITILLMSWNSVIRSVILLPMKKDNQYLNALVCAAIVNVVLNSIFIPFYGGIGAAIGTIGAYSVIWLIQNMYARKYFEIKKYLLYGRPYLIVGLLMFLIVREILIIFPVKWWTLFFAIIVGILVYIGFLVGKIIFYPDDFGEYLLNMLSSKLSLLKRKRGRDHDKNL